MEFDGMEAARQLAAMPPEPPKVVPLHSSWTAPARGMGAGALESVAAAGDALKAFGQSLGATGTASAGGMFALPSEREQKDAESAAAKLASEGASFDSEKARLARGKAASLRPDPRTAGIAENLVFNATRVLTKAVGYTVGTGPVGGAVLTGADEGMTTANDLRLQGVDKETRTKVGATVGAITAVGGVLPVAGGTFARTAALVAAGGPASFVGQQVATKKILADANYADLARDIDPLDPAGMLLSGVLPAGFGALAMRSAARATARAPLADLSVGVRRKLAYNDPKLDAYASEAAAKHGVPPEVLLAIKNAGEKSASTSTSPKGARGVMQFMPETWKEMGGGDATDPVVSMDRGAAYLAKLHQQYGDWRAAVAHYNGGKSQADLVLAGKAPSFPETAAYLSRVDAFVGAHQAEHLPTVAIPVSRETLDAAMVQNVTELHDMLAAGEAHPGSSIPRSAALSAEDRAIENALATRVEKDFSGAATEYAAHPETAGGKILNTDIARELSPGYLADRTRSAAVHEPASWFVKKLYEQRLAEMQPGGKVLFTSGGTGAGKTSAVQNIPTLHRLTNDAAVVYDTNMNTLASSVAKVEQALSAGGNVTIVHVQRDAVEALTGGALPRAMRQAEKHGSGRTVPLVEHLRTHRGAAEVIQQLSERYKDDPRVQISVIDNTHGKGGARLSDVNFVRGFDYNGLEGKLHDALQSEFDAGRISGDVLRGTYGPAAPRLLEAERAGHGRGTERGDPGAPGRPASGDGAGQKGGLSGLGSLTDAQIKGIEDASGDPKAAIESVRARLAAVEASAPKTIVRIDDSGNPVTAADELAAIRKEASEGTDSELGTQDAELLRVAAECALRGGAT